jgi:hypothetical protein
MKAKKCNPSANKAIALQKQSIQTSYFKVQRQYQKL